MNETSSPTFLLLTLFCLLGDLSENDTNINRFTLLKEILKQSEQKPPIKKKSVISLPTPDATLFSLREEVLQQTNLQRKKQKLPPLQFREDLNQIANAKAVDIAVKKYFSHISPTYGSPFNLLRQLGIPYHYAGENIAKGQLSAEEVLHDWMASSGHRKNILSRYYTRIGIGVYPINPTNFVWTQLFWG